MIRVDRIWLAPEPMDMRAGPKTCLARVVRVFGSAKTHHAYVFLNKRANRLKVLAARRLHKGRFLPAQVWQQHPLELSSDQLQVLVVGMPWQEAGTENAEPPGFVGGHFV